ncbi:MAG: hypothetical protein WC489_03380 [Patescibacteria group bacterium]
MREQKIVPQPVDFLPSHKKFLDFINGQDGSQVERDVFSSGEDITFLVPVPGDEQPVLNTVKYFYPEGQRTLHPTDLTQYHVNGPVSTDIFVCGGRDGRSGEPGVYTQVIIKNPTNEVDVINIGSRHVFLSEFSIDCNVDGDEGDKPNTYKANGIMVDVRGDYGRRLIEEGVFPEHATGRIVIHTMEGIDGGRITALVSQKLMLDRNPEVYLDEDQLERICRDLGLEFEIDMQRGETRGSIGGYTFTVGHVDMDLLDTDRVWKCLTGDNPGSPYLMPVQVAYSEETS